MLETVFLIAAVGGGTVMICQFLMSLMGMGDDGADVGGDADFDASGDVGEAEGHHHTSIKTAADAEYQHSHGNWLFGVLSFRTLIAAAAFFGLTGMAARSAGMADGPSLLLALAIGLCAMYGMYWLMLSISRLTASGTQHIGNALGQPATVYVPIPAARAGTGKVQLSMQNRIVEYQAVTEGHEPLKTGESVEVVGVAGSDVVEVRRVPEAVEA